MIGKCFITILILVLPIHAQAADIKYSNTQDTAVGTWIAESERLELLAARWQVTTQEWTRYEEIMQGEGRYHWRDVDPIMVLGIYAQTTAERERYAAMMAEKEHRLQTQFLTFNQAYMKAFDRRYGAQLIMDLDPFYEQYRMAGIASSIRTTSEQSTIPDENTLGDRYVLFLNTQCTGCDEWFRKIKTQQDLGSAIDMYFIDESKDAIGQWAKRMEIDPSELEDGAVTLNLDSDLYNQYGSPGIPAAYYYDASFQSVLRLKDEESLP